MFWPMKNDKLRHAAIHGINFVKDKIDGLCFTMYDGTTATASENEDSRQDALSKSSSTATLREYYPYFRLQFNSSQEKTFSSAKKSCSQSTASSSQSPATHTSQEDLEQGIASAMEKTEEDNAHPRNRMEEENRVRLERVTDELREAHQNHLSLERELQGMKHQLSVSEATCCWLREEVRTMKNIHALELDEQIESINSQLDNRLKSLQECHAINEKLRERIRRSMLNFTHRYNQSIRDQEVFWRFGIMLWTELIQTRDFQTRVNEPSSQDLVKYAYAILGYNVQGDNILDRQFPLAEGLDAVELFVDYGTYPFGYDETQEASTNQGKVAIREGGWKKEEEMTRQTYGDGETMGSDTADLEEFGFGEADTDRNPRFTIFEDETAAHSNAGRPVNQHDQLGGPPADINMAYQPGFRVPTFTDSDKSDDSASFSEPSLPEDMLPSSTSSPHDADDHQPESPAPDNDTTLETECSAPEANVQKRSKDRRKANKKKKENMMTFLLKGRKSRKQKRRN